MDGFETLSVVLRSDVRLSVLRYVLEEGPTTVAEISRHVDASRRTVSRSVTALEDVELLANTGRTYQPTTEGELLARDLLELIDNRDHYRKRAAFLDEFPTDALDADLRAVDGTITPRRSAHPHAPVSRVIERLSAANSITILAPVASSIYIRPLVARVGTGTPVEAIVHEQAYAEFCSRLHGGVRLASKLGAVTLEVHEDVPFGLVQCDDWVVLGAYDDGVLQATFETKESVARDAAREAFQRYRTEAERVID